MRARLALAGICLLALAGGATVSAARTAAPGDTLVELVPGRAAPAAPSLRAAGGTLVSPELAIWKLPAGAAARLLPALESRDLVRSVAADRRIAPLGTVKPLPGAVKHEWWIAAMGAAGLVPPGPGKPVTVVDTGLDFTHPDFAGRPDTIALNRQHITADDFHGTSISSLIGGQGRLVLGIYPRARLLEWDASEGTGLQLSSIIEGIETAAKHGRGVINLSLGSAADVPMLDDAILEAFRKGSIVVAATGDMRGFDFSPYPASYPHVLTVSASDRHGQASDFSSPSSTIDVAAPGVDMTVDVPSVRDPSGLATANGTSYSAALVSGALAWIWTRRPSLDNTQLIALVRRTAKQTGVGGYNNGTGYGVLNLRAALAAPAPAPDPLEPNDDVNLVRPGGLFVSGSKPLTSPDAPHAVLHARVDQVKDPSDVYRAWIPAHGTLAVSVRAQSGDVILRVWGPTTPTILERGGREHRDLLATGRGDLDPRVSVPNGGGAAEPVYIEVSPGIARTASYTLTVTAQ